MEEIRLSSEGKQKAFLGSLGTATIGLLLIYFFGQVGDVIGFVFVVAAVAYVLEAFTWKLEYDNEKIRKSSIFKTRVIRYEEVTFFKVVKTWVAPEKKASKLVFTVVSEGTVPIEINILHLDPMTKSKLIQDMETACKR